MQTHTIHITPRCRRPVRGQVFLKRLRVEGDRFSFSLPSSCFRLVPACNPRVLYATDTRAAETARGIRLLLPEKTDRLFTTAIWQVTLPGEPAFDVLHVIQWLLPRYLIRTPYNGVLASQTRHDYCPQSSMIRGVMSPGLVGRW